MIEHVDDAKVVASNGEVYAILPMTKATGKIRLKRRNSFSDYGEPFATRKNKIGLTTYIEWQIGYDLPLKGKKGKSNAPRTSLSNITFSNYKDETKYVYELSEIVYHSYKHGIISDGEIKKLKEQIKNVPDSELIENKKITKSVPVATKIGGLDYYEMEVSYPLVVHKFGEYDIYAEVINREKQRAVGVQPMLYVCLPITSVEFKDNVLGRTLEAKECSKWKIGDGEAKLALELFRVFGMLSIKHRFDILALLDMLFPDIS